MAGYLDESSQMSDIRIHVKEISSGKILRGEEAPLASELENWLKENPGYVEVPRDEVSSIELFPLTICYESLKKSFKYDFVQFHYYKVDLQKV